MLDKKMEQIKATFNTQMAAYEKDLKEKATMSLSSNPQEISTIAQEFTEFKAFVWGALDLVRGQMELLLVGQDRLEQASRRKILLLHGVPEVGDEEADETVRAVLRNQMKLPPQCALDVGVAHRLGSKSKASKPRPLLVRFMSFKSRSEAWKGKTVLKGTGISLSEFLTKPRHEVFAAGRKHFGMRNCWSSEGRIVLLLPNKCRQKVESMMELQELMDKFPSSATEPRGKDAPARKPAAAGAPAAAPPAPIPKRRPGAGVKKAEVTAIKK